MYSSTNNNGYSSFTNQPKTSSSSFLYNCENEINHSKPFQENYYPPSSSSSHLHSPHYINNPLEDESIFRDLFQHPFSNEIVATMEKSTNTNQQTVMKPKDNTLTKRSSNKDRHSKINTAQGPRDRRMRLSLDVAEKFFRLQDMLGFDKASKTIEWLITKSNPAIQELLPHPLNQNCSFMGVSNSASSTSDCEVLSGVDDQETTNKDKAKCSYSSKEKKKFIKGVRRSAIVHHPHAKETRERARARARERTMDKRNNKLGYGGTFDDYQYSKFRPYSNEGVLDQDVNRLGSWSPFERNQVKQGIVGDNSSLMVPDNWSPSFLFNYQQNGGVSLEHQFSDFQTLGKPWEGNNN